MKTTPKKVEVNMARGRLRGALNDSLNGHDSDGDDDDDSGRKETSKEQSKTKASIEKLPRNRRLQLSPFKIHLATPKKNKNKHKLLTDNCTKPGETFVMKLFDRSLDLSNYTEKTPLFPICRAWMANQPRNPEVHRYIKARSPTPVKYENNEQEIVQRLYRGEVVDVFNLPKSKPATVPKIPKPISRPKVDPLENDDLTGSTKEKLLAANMKLWKATRKNWMEHAKEYNKRFANSHEILELLAKRQ